MCNGIGRCNGLSIKRKVPASMPFGDPQEFIALLLHAQSNGCNCVFAKYFKKLAKQMVSQFIKGE